MEVPASATLRSWSDFLEDFARRCAQCTTCCPVFQEPVYLRSYGVDFCDPVQVSEVSGPAGHFKATTNERVNLMYKEAGEFARRLQKCSNQVKAVESATAGAIGMQAISSCLHMFHAVQHEYFMMWACRTKR